jgi:short-subunit dehydrogenase
LKALGRGKGHVVSGLSNLVMVEVERLVPRSVVVRVAGRMMRKSFGENDK